MIKLYHIFFEFFRLGLIAFGGPAAHAALLESELVSKKKWITRQQFLDYLGGVNLIPGPNSTQLTMLIGYHLKGFWGMISGGVGFMLPAATITAIVAVFYVHYQHIPAMETILDGIKPAILVLIIGAVFKLGKKAVKNSRLAVLGIIVLVISLAGINEITAILGAGFLGMIIYATGHIKRSKNLKSIFIPFLTLLAPAASLATYSGLQLFWVFLKIGAMLFGSGYVLIAYVNTELVENLGWITPGQLLDAIAIGQITPGPLISSATFIGFLLDGWSGAVIATIAIVLPSFVFILILHPFIGLLRKSPYTSAFLDAVNVAAVGVMAAVFIVFGMDIITGWQPVLIMLLAALAMWGPYKINTLWIIGMAAALGFLLDWIQ